MPARSIRITCPGATAAGIATTLLIGGGARFSAAPLGDGRWLIEAEVADATASLLALRIGEPLIVEDDEPEPPAVPAEPVTAPDDVEALPPPPTDVVDRTVFVARTIPAAKTAALKVARGFGATPYPGEAWAFDGELFSRSAYRTKRPGKIVFGADVGGDFWVGWRPTP